MLKKRWIYLLISVVFLSILLTYIINSLVNDNKPKVVVVLKTVETESEYWKIVGSGAKKAFQDFNIDGQVIAPNLESQVSEQVDILKDVLKTKPDALIVASIQPSANIPILEEYKKNNIPVLLVDTEADWNGQTMYIGTDNYTLGERSGQLLGSMLQPRNQVAFIHSKIVNPDMVKRLKGAKDALNAIGIEVVTELPADNESGEVNIAIRNILQTFPNINGVFAANDKIAINTLGELTEKGVQIPVVGTDGTMKMLKEVEEERISATIAQNPYDMGYISVEKAHKAIIGDPLEKRIDSGVDIIIKGNSEKRMEFLTTRLK
ncbi:MAG: sugar ABC transporter substrate-binding protein [Bacillota bacterium]